MKKTPALLLALSLIANAALAVMVVRAPSHSASTATNSSVKASSTTAGNAVDATIASAINSGNTATLLAQLKAAGLSDKDARFMAAGLELKKFADQMTELVPQEPYWRSRGMANMTPEARAKMQQMMMTMGRTMQDLLSEVVPQAGINNQYSYLSPERRTELRRLEKDYDDLNAEMMATASSFRLKSDSDNMKALAAERKREIDQFLTPAEITARDMRESPAARLIKNEYGNIIENEAEYQSAYALMQAAGSDPAAQDAARAQIEATLGADRMTKLAQLNDPDYALIQSAVTRLKLPAAETTASLTAIRTEAQQASAAITADTSLNAAQKKAALKDLSAKSQEQMTAVLGAEGAETYSQRSRWMGSLKNGSSFTIDAKGKFSPKK